MYIHFTWFFLIFRVGQTQGIFLVPFNSAPIPSKHDWGMYIVLFLCNPAKNKLLRLSTVTLSLLATMLYPLHLKYSPNVSCRHKISLVLLSWLMLWIIIIISLLCLKGVDFHPIIHERKVPSSNSALFVLPHRMNGMSDCLPDTTGKPLRKNGLLSLSGPFFFPSELSSWCLLPLNCKLPENAEWTWSVDGWSVTG